LTNEAQGQLPPFHAFSLGELKTDVAAPDVLARYLSSHFEDANFNPLRSISYCCETLNAMDTDLANTVIREPGFGPAVRVILEEHKYLPHRDVPIAVDLALRFKSSDPKKTSALLTAYCDQAVAVLGKDYHTAHVSALLFLASHNPADATNEYRQRLIASLGKFFPRLTNNQLNRVFDDRNAMNCFVLRDMSGDFIKSGNIEALCRLYVLSPALFSDLTRMLQQEIQNHSGKLARVHEKNRNLVDWLGTDHLFRIFGHKKRAKKTARVRLAICISGQLRGYETAFETWRDTLKLEDIDYEIFVSTWSDIGTKKLNGSHMYRHFPEGLALALQQLWLRLGEERFHKTLPNLCRAVESSRMIDEDTLKTFYRTENVLVQDNNVFAETTSNSERMHYKIESTQNLLSRSQREFDLVLRIRPDKALYPFNDGIDWTALNDECQRSKVLYSDFAPIFRTHQGLSIGDQVLLTSWVHSDVIFRPFSLHYYINGKGGAVAVPDQFRAHATLGSLCLMSGMEVRRMPGLVLSDKHLVGPKTLALEEIAYALQQDRETATDLLVNELLAQLAAGSNIDEN